MDYHTFRAPLNAADRLMLDSAEAQHRERGWHLVADLAAAAGIRPSLADYRVKRMVRLGLWPHGAARGRKPARVRPEGAPPYEVTAGDVRWALAVGRKVGREVPQLADECASAALVGLAKATRRFDTSPGCVPFRAYARPGVWGAAVTFLRGVYPAGYRRNCAKVWPGEAPPKTRSLSSSFRRRAEYDDAEANESVADAVPSDEPPVGWELDMEDELRAAAARLTPYQRRVFLAVHLEANENHADAARRLRLDESMVCRTLKACYEELRRRGVPHRAG